MTNDLYSICVHCHGNARDHDNECHSQPGCKETAKIREGEPVPFCIFTIQRCCCLGCGLFKMCFLYSTVPFHLYQAFHSGVLYLRVEGLPQRCIPSITTVIQYQYSNTIEPITVIFYIYVIMQT